MVIDGMSRTMAYLCLNCTDRQPASSCRLGASGGVGVRSAWCQTVNCWRRAKQARAARPLHGLFECSSSVSASAAALQKMHLEIHARGAQQPNRRASPATAGGRVRNRVRSTCHCMPHAIALSHNLLKDDDKFQIHDIVCLKTLPIRTN